VTHASFGLAVAGSQAGPAGAGLYVTSTTPGGPAAVAGIRAGDVIVELDGSSAASADQLQGLTLTRRPGETVRISVERDGERHDVEVTLGEQPSR
jgi:S1-C subfamily serine protease